MSETNLSFRIDQDVKNKLEKLAGQDARTLANYARLKLTELVKNDGKFTCSKCGKKI